jgi:hypothetical protein
MTEVKLGQIITGDSHRDAIHIAIAPVIAGEDIYPGSEVGLKYGTKDVVVVKDSVYGLKPVGIVDPFLKHYVKKGEKCYVCLFPNTVTGLRHEWTHPAFDEKQKPTNESELWLREFADKWSMQYETLLVEAKTKDGYATALGIDLHSSTELDPGDEKLFWYHMEQIHGKKFDEKHRENFWWSCSC